MELIEKILLYENRNLSLFIKNSLEILLEYLNITTELLLSSDIKKTMNLKDSKKLWPFEKNSILQPILTQLVEWN